jgi:hypothetical protein
MKCNNNVWGPVNVYYYSIHPGYKRAAKNHRMGYLKIPHPYGSNNLWSALEWVTIQNPPRPRNPLWPFKIRHCYVFSTSVMDFR